MTVKLTEQGRALKSILIPIAKHVNDQPLTEFDADDIVQLKRMLERLRNNLTGENE
jgi:DNA-binding MarR family transcriptional regulator